MAGVILRTAGGTLLFVAFLWLVRIDDYRVAGMMLTFPMLNGMGLVGAGVNAERLAKSMMPVITLNGAMCFLFALALVAWPAARAHPGVLTAAATAAWIGIYAALETGNVSFTRTSSMSLYLAACAAASIAVTYWLWPACPSLATGAAVRAGGISGVLEGWPTILLFAASLAILFGFAHRFQHAHAAIGRLAALPMVPLFGLYAVATTVGSGPEAIGKLETMRSMVLVGWVLAMAFAVALSRYCTRSTSGTAQRAAAMIIGWGLCLGCILASARVAAAAAGCE